MSIELLQGYTGCGKSYIAMTKVVDHLYEGGVVGLNFRLTNEWAYICALNHPKYKNGSASYEECVKSLHSRCFYVGNVQTITDLAKMGLDLCEGWARKRRERKTLVVVDEAQLYLNARNFRENFPWLQLGTQHRKMGLDFLLLAHHISMIDNQLSISSPTSPAPTTSMSSSVFRHRSPLSRSLLLPVHPSAREPQIPAPFYRFPQTAYLRAV
ncbi:MAG: zonular occludens toxin domain-containing protein [Candidatus Electronema sp. V4]|uniref:zonular occludens toxin domain-containing protein n=1 Tax=Candidatus Electronema sp. V4 TaxID=3454756 RepID=UPI0040556018